MGDMSFEYWNTLANQIIMISSLLGGFSIAVIANFLVSETKGRLQGSVMVSSVLSAGFFLVALFAMTKVFMTTTPGFPIDTTQRELSTTSLIGGLSFFLGIFSLVAILSLSGWTKSRAMGIFTSSMGFIVLVLILMMLT